MTSRDCTARLAVACASKGGSAFKSLAGEVNVPALIALVTRLDQAEEDAWLEALTATMPNESIVPFRTLDPSQRHDVEIAIVADPDPADVVALPSLALIQSKRQTTGERAPGRLDSSIASRPNPCFNVSRSGAAPSDTRMASGAVPTAKASLGTIESPDC